MFATKYLIAAGVLAVLLSLLGVQTYRLKAAQADLQVQKSECATALAEISASSAATAAAGVAESLRNRVIQLEADKKLSDEVAKAALARNASDSKLLKRLNEELKNESTDPESCLGRNLSDATRERLRAVDEAGRRDGGQGSDEVRAGPGTG